MEPPPCIGSLRLRLDLSLHATDRVAEALAHRFTGIDPASCYVSVSAVKRGDDIGQSGRGLFSVHFGEYADRDRRRQPDRGSPSQRAFDSPCHLRRDEPDALP